MNDAAEPLPWMFGAGISIFSFLLGFVTSRVTMTRKEGKDIEQKNYENSTRLVELHAAAYDKYTEAIIAYTNTDEGTFDTFVAIATTGDKYFYQAMLMCDAILSDKVDRVLRDNTLVPKIVKMAEATLPRHYEILQSIAAKKGFAYKGALRREDYRSIYDVVEKYGAAGPWTEIVR